MNMDTPLIIREAIASDLDQVLAVERAAFATDEEANLVKDLLADQSAEPIVSLLACIDHRAIGHILFSHARLEPNHQLSISLLAPLAVIPEYQRQGVGGKLIKSGLEILSKRGISLVFVLGYPDYYPRFGFKPAARLGLYAPYPIAEKNSDAWMVRRLNTEVIGDFNHQVVCADKLNQAEYWQE